ncbi:amidase [Peribacillus cavernae]|uniref:Amidase n=1 Tax=Peribacillus cavernae TaxID=1674310 RepID=A0A433HBK7_9BACI|nr:amidase family protein [Peribacillus cavernae]MDQ0221406.1 Asp-tRNA(Asn)/Glu-tRNA(Gln) amidotransferase A subunit family amidase [Peribacillus cavernae]RUQ25800.1 amidase [Peribacillus cavernae]
MSDLAYMSAIDLRKAILDREISSIELVKSSLNRLDELEPKLNAFVSVDYEGALKQAKEADEELANGKELGPLHGLPISIKDLIDVKDLKTTFGSRTMVNNVAKTDAPSVERIRKAGACIIGKTTTTEFGCKAGGGDSPVTGVTRNAWDLEKTTGGSSAGAATSTAAGITPFSLGTDGGGSIRIPSSYCGLFGIKAQFGRVPIYPVSATPTLAHVGPLARTVKDAALLLSIISGFDSRDPYSVSENVPDFVAACEQPINGLKIAWSPTLGYARPNKEVVDATNQAIKTFENMGCHIELVDRLFEEDPIDLWTSEFYAGVGTKLKSALENSRDLLDPAVADILDLARNQTIEDYYRKVIKRFQFRENVRETFNHFDIIMSPTLPVPPFGAGENVPAELSDRSIVSWVYYTYPFNLSGNPAASIPCGFTSEGLPIGLQIISNTNREVDIFKLASAFEKERPWASKTPSL